MEILIYIYIYILIYSYMEILIILVSSLGITGLIICLIMVSFQFNSLVVQLLGVLNNSSISSQSRLSTKVHE